MSSAGDAGRGWSSDLEALARAEVGRWVQYLGGGDPDVVWRRVRPDFFRWMDVEKVLFHDCRSDTEKTRRAITQYLLRLEECGLSPQLLRLEGEPPVLPVASDLMALLPTLLRSTARVQRPRRDNGLDLHCICASLCDQYAHHGPSGVRELYRDLHRDKGITERQVVALKRWTDRLLEQGERRHRSAAFTLRWLTELRHRPDVRARLS